MADTARSIDLLSAEDYLERERSSAHRHEYCRGAVFAMSGGTDRHNRIAVNLTAALSSHLPDRCVAYMADMKVRVKTDRAESYYYPDSMVCCGTTDQSLDWRDDPILIAEVLPSSTERTDRTEKFYAYVQIPTLQEYVLIEQDARRVEVFRRSNDWQREVLAGGDTLRLPSIGFDMPVDALYRRVTFET